MHAGVIEEGENSPKEKPLQIEKMLDPSFFTTQTELFIHSPIPVILIKLRFFICLKTIM